MKTLLNMRFLLIAVLVFAGCRSHQAGRFAGVVSAATPQAADAGRVVLEAGGNAVDAAVAVAFALAVTEPAGSGLGGQAILLIHPPGGEPFVLNGTTLAPRDLPAALSADDLEGRRLSTVPSMVKVLYHAWKKHGSGNVSWPTLLAPATRHAEEGFALGAFGQRSLVRYADALREDPTAARLFLEPDGSVPAQGDVLRQPVLARTLRRLAEAGGEDFYRGEIAKTIAADMKAHGGWITLADLESFPPPPEVAPLRTTYRGWNAYSLPPPAGGWVVLQMLGLLENVPTERLVARSPDRTLWLAETLARGHLSRDRAPIKNLVDYRRDVERELSRARINALWKRMRRPGSGETTHLSLVDGSGMAVAATLSINAYFGARRASPDLGFLYNSYMTEFESENPTHPFALRGRAQPYSSMAGTILARNGQVGLVVGSPGSRRIISAVVQVISRWADGGESLEAAVAGSRVHAVTDDEVFVEREPPRAVLLALERRGFSVSKPLSSLFQADRSPYFGGVHAVAREGNGWVGAADPRRDGAVRTARIATAK